MDIQKKHSLPGAVIIVSCFLLLAGACEKSDELEAGDRAKNVPLGFSASTTGAAVTATKASSVSGIDGFDANSYDFSMSITKDNGSTVFEGSDVLKATMAKAASGEASQWNWSFKIPSGTEVHPNAPVGQNLKIRACYPACATAGEFSQGIPFDFSGTSDTGTKTDILYASRSYSVPDIDPATVSLDFKHACSWIVVKVWKLNDGGAPVTLTGVSINNLAGGWIKNKGNIDRDSGYAMEGSTVGPIGEVRGSGEALSVKPTGSGNAITYEFLVPSFMDATVNDGNIVVSMMINGKQALFPLKREHLNTISIPGGAIQYGFRQGYKNTYEFVFNNTALDLRLLDWTSVDINQNCGEKVNVPTNFKELNFKGTFGSHPALLPDSISISFLSSGVHKYNSYLTSVEYGANGDYITPDSYQYKNTKGDVTFNDDRNVAKEEAFSYIQMTTDDISIEPIPWQDGTGRLVAKEICKKYNGGGNNDWRLPRAGELRCFFVYQILNGGFNEMKAFNFQNSNNYKLYWTGTEGSADKAWAMYYCNETGSIVRGPMISLEDKSTKCYVRCIRDMQ